MTGLPEKSAPAYSGPVQGAVWMVAAHAHVEIEGRRRQGHPAASTTPVSLRPDTLNGRWHCRTSVTAARWAVLHRLRVLVLPATVAQPLTSRRCLTLRLGGLGEVDSLAGVARLLLAIRRPRQSLGLRSALADVETSNVHCNNNWNSLSVNWPHCLQVVVRATGSLQCSVIYARRSHCAYPLARQSILLATSVPTCMLQASVATRGRGEESCARNRSGQSRMRR